MTTEHEYEDETDASAREQLAMQVAEPAPETSEYVREFSEDRVIDVDPETGEYIDGNIPQTAKLKNWGVDNPNYVFGNLSKDYEFRKLELLEGEVEMVNSMYHINYEAINRIKERIKDLPREEQEEVLSRAILALKKAERDKQDALDDANQRIHAFMKKTRARGGNERKWMVTKSVISGTHDTGSKAEGGLFSKLFGRSK